MGMELRREVVLGKWWWVVVDGSGGMCFSSLRKAKAYMKSKEAQS